MPNKYGQGIGGFTNNGTGTTTLGIYGGTYNASTNRVVSTNLPLVNGDPNVQAGTWYWVTTEGTNNPTGQNLVVNQAIVYDGSVWQAGGIANDSDQIVVAADYIVINGLPVQVGDTLTVALGKLQGQINALANGNVQSDRVIVSNDFLPAPGSTFSVSDTLTTALNSLAGQNLVTGLSGSAILIARAVYEADDGKFYYGDGTSDATSDIVGLAIATVNTNTPIYVKTNGTMQNGGWAWIPNKPVFLLPSTTSGVLTQSLPTKGQRSIFIGKAISADTININIINNGLTL